MKRNCFSPRLYWEGIRQLRLMGILFTVGVSLITVFSPIAEYIASLERETVTAQQVGCFEMNPLIVLAFCIVAPFLTLNLFSFVNKRESSDFYHAVPATRGCLFLSFFAAVVTWLLLFTAVTTALSVLCHAIFPSLFIINYASVCIISLNCFIGGIFIAACVAIAMSLTGTLLMNVLLALLLIFLPRTLLWVTADVITSAFPLVGSGSMDFLPFLDFSYNIPVGYVFQYMFGSTANNPLTQWSSSVYTLVIAVIYLIIALLLFRRRRSEGAGHAAPTPLLQAVYRVLVGFTISSFITLIVFSAVTGSYTLNTEDMFGYGFLYLLSIFAMVVFEILCTRRFKGLLRRSAISVVLLVAANAALLFGAQGTVWALSSYRPAAEDISSIRISSSYDINAYSSDNDYFAERAAQIKITDPKVLSMISTRLQHTLDLWETSPDRYYQTKYESTSLTVYFGDGLFEKKRTVILYDEDVDLLSTALSDNAAYRDIYMQLPTNYSHITMDGTKPESKDAATRLVTTLQQEINRLGFEQWYEIINGSVDDAGFAFLGIYVPAADGWSTISVPLYPSLLTETSRVYLDVFREENAKSYTQIPALLAAVDDENVLIYDMCISSRSSADSEVWLGQDDVERYREEFAAIMSTVDPDAPIDPTQQFYLIQLYCEIETETDESWDIAYNQYQAFFALDEETAAQLAALVLTIMEQEGAW